MKEKEVVEMNCNNSGGTAEEQWNSSTLGLGDGIMPILMDLNNYFVGITLKFIHE